MQQPAVRILDGHRRAERVGKRRHQGAGLSLAPDQLSELSSRHRYIPRTSRALARSASGSNGLVM